MIIFKLSKIFSCSTKRIVHRLVSSDGKNHIRSSSCHNCTQQSISRYNFHIDLNSRIRSKGIVHHGFQNSALVTTAQDPNRNYFFIILLIDITNRIIVNVESCRKCFDLMPHFREEVRFVFFRFCICAGNYQIIDIQFRFTHIQNRSTERSNIVFKCCKLFRNLVRLFYKSLQLLRKSLRRRNLIGFLSRISNHFIYNLVEAFGFQIHSFHHFRIYLINIVIAVLIRRCSGIYQKFPVNLIQTINRIFQFFQQNTGTAQCSFQTNGMCSFCKINFIRISICICESQIVPVILIFEGNLFHFFKWDFSIDIYRSGRYTAAGIILSSLNSNIVITVLRNRKLPFDPLACTAPCFSAYIIQNCIRHTVWLSVRRRFVIFRIQR